MEEYTGYQKFNNPTPVKKKSNKKIWFLVISIPALFILIILMIFLFGNFSSKTISETELSQGKSFELKENKEVKFIHNEEEHTLTLSSVNDNIVYLTIQSEIFAFSLLVGEEKKFDLDSDGIYDVKVKLNSLKDGVPEIYVKEISENVCTENWNCENWVSCSNQGSQTRTCTDSNSCGTTIDKPSTTQSCACFEDWSCNAWNSCINGTQTRTCTDSNSCGTTIDKPPISKSCGVCNEVWTCGSWNSCINGTQTRTCTDSNSCNATGSILTAEQNCTSEIIDCGYSFLTRDLNDTSGFDCFIDASENCEESKLILISDVEFFVVATTATEMQIKGIESNKCVYYRKTINQTVKFSDEMVEFLLNNGTTQQEIDQEEQRLNDEEKENWGLETTCKFNTTDLTTMLTNWKNINSSPDDFNVAECD